MSLQREIVSEKHIISMLQAKNPLAWEKLYDKYASAMYGLIFNITKDKSLAEDIFMGAFLDLKQKQILSDIKYALCPAILRYTFSYTTKYLKEIGMTPKPINPPKEGKLIHLINTQCNSLIEAATLLNITVNEAKKRLLVEFKTLRMLNIISENPQNRREL
jgi:hypothetical protein